METLGPRSQSRVFQSSSIALLLPIAYNGVDTEHSDDKIAAMKVKVKKAVEVVRGYFVCSACLHFNDAQCVRDVTDTSNCVHAAHGSEGSHRQGEGCTVRCPSQRVGGLHMEL